MRLLNVNSKQFREFTKNIPPYVVTSHRWSDNETTYQNVREKQNTDSAGYHKVEDFCTIAQLSNNERQTGGSDSGCDWIWVDTCCIDKTSSAEVTESINSMFSWYKQAHHCIAYLADVRPLSAGLDAVMGDFRQSEWFERGWTLQELLAPSCVIFVTKNWEPVGHKCSKEQTCAGCAEFHNAVLNAELAEITGVPEEILWNYEKSNELRPKAKWNWTTDRKTTKPEDTAYCLLGIFDVYMPLIYGEGARNASERLRQEIRKRNKARTDKPRPGRRSEWSPWSGEPLFPGQKMQPLPGLWHGQDQTLGESMGSDFESTELHYGRVNSSRRSSGRSSPRSNFPETNRAVKAGLSPAQIAAAGGDLHKFDLDTLSRMDAAQIALARQFRLYRDSSEPSEAQQGEVKAAMDAQPMKNCRRRTGFR